MNDILKRIKNEARDDIDRRLIQCNHDKQVLQAEFEAYRAGVDDTIRRYEEVLKER